MLSIISDQQAVSEYLKSFGVLGPIVLFVLMIAQVFVAVIPGHALMVTPDTATPLAAENLAALRARIDPENAPARLGLEVLTQLLTTRARDWASERGQLCRAPRRQDAPAQILARWHCIDRRHARLLPILDSVHGDPHELPGRILAATTAIEQLPTCRATEQPAPVSPPEREAWLAERLEAALFHENAGDYHEAEHLARAVIAAGESPRLAEATYRLGHILGAQDRSGEALRTLEHAENLASADHRDELACQILAYRVKLRASTELTVEAGERDLARADASIVRSATTDPLVRAEVIEAQGLLAGADRP